MMTLLSTCIVYRRARLADLEGIHKIDIEQRLKGNEGMFYFMSNEE